MTEHQTQSAIIDLIRLRGGAQVLIKMENDYVVIATYYYDGISSRWKNDSGNEIGKWVKCWKGLEE